MEKAKSSYKRKRKIIKIEANLTILENEIRILKQKE